MDMATCVHRFVGTWAAIALAVYSLALVVVANRERLVASMAAMEGMQHAVPLYRNTLAAGTLSQRHPVASFVRAGSRV